MLAKIQRHCEKLLSGRTRCHDKQLSSRHNTCSGKDMTEGVMADCERPNNKVGQFRKRIKWKEWKKKKNDKLQLSIFILVSEMMTIQAGVFQIPKKGCLLSTI